ncbi:hypothetical protein ACHAPT_005502 [Fusarium lateritium]
MGEFDCYCAICSAALNDNVEIGSRQPRALKRRRELVRRKREGLPPDDPESDEGSDKAPSDDESEDWYEDEEDAQYDPELVSEESLEWLAEVSCLGFNPSALDGDRTFFADAEPYDDYGQLILRPGDDPNQPEETDINCYYPSEANKSSVFPFHKVCYRMLQRVVAYNKGSPSVDGGVLYTVMAGLSGQYSTCLEINYGPISGREQFWEPHPGEEFSVTNPDDVDDFYHHLQEKLISGSFQPSTEASVLGPASPDDDPFSRLSGELIREIANIVPCDALLSLRSVSRPFYHDTRSNSFWKSRIATDMPWLWDLNETLGVVAAQLDYRKLYAWLEVVTTPKFGVETPFLAIANRRRIWKSCIEIADYCKEVEKMQYAMEPDLEIVEQAYRPILFKVAPTQASREDGISQTFWLYSWKEMDKSRFRSFIFEVFWNDEDLLTGFGVVLGSSRRIFGVEGGRKGAARMAAGDWIAEMTLLFGQNRQSESKAIAGIQSITLKLRSGLRVQLGKQQEGQTRADGVISRLGILEKPIYEEKPLPFYGNPGPLAQRLVWTAVAHPLWQRPDVKMSPIFPPGLAGACPEDDLSPYQILSWARSRGELEKLSRVTAYTPKKLTDATERSILGLRAEFVKRYWEPKRYVGDGENWPEEDMTHLDLIGTDGEKIIEIGVPKSGTLKGLVLKTNRHKFVIFGQGEPEPENWRMVQVPDGDFIIGIAVTFDSDPNTGAAGPMASVIMLHESLE